MPQLDTTIFFNQFFWFFGFFFSTYYFFAYLVIPKINLYYFIRYNLTKVITTFDKTFLPENVEKIRVTQYSRELAIAHSMNCSEAWKQFYSNSIGDIFGLPEPISLTTVFPISSKLHRFLLQILLKETWNSNTILTIYTLTIYDAMLIYIIYIWILDLFLYSNTEIFLIFFIFLNFGVLAYTLTTWYHEYLDDRILDENRTFYILVFSLRKKFIVLRQKLLFTNSWGGASLTVNSPYEASFIFSILIKTFCLAADKQSQYLRYSALLQYLKIILLHIYELGLIRLRRKFQNELKHLQVHLLDSTAVPSTISVDVSSYSFHSPIFSVFLTEFYKIDYSNEFVFYWVVNLPLSNFVTIYLEYVRDL